MDLNSLKIEAIYITFTHRWVYKKDFKLFSLGPSKFINQLLAFFKRRDQQVGHVGLFLQNLTDNGEQLLHHLGVLIHNDLKQLCLAGQDVLDDDRVGLGSVDEVSSVQQDRIVLDNTGNNVDQLVLPGQDLVHHNLTSLDQVWVVAEDIDGQTDHLRLLGGHSVG